MSTLIESFLNFITPEKSQPKKRNREAALAKHKARSKISDPLPSELETLPGTEASLTPIPIEITTVFIFYENEEVIHKHYVPKRFDSLLEMLDFIHMYVLSESDLLKKLKRSQTIRIAEEKIGIIDGKKVRYSNIIAECNQYANLILSSVLS